MCCDDAADRYPQNAVRLTLEIRLREFAEQIRGGFQLPIAEIGVRPRRVHIGAQPVEGVAETLRKGRRQARGFAVRTGDYQQFGAVRGLTFGCARG